MAIRTHKEIDKKRRESKLQEELKIEQQIKKENKQRRIVNKIAKM